MRKCYILYVKSPASKPYVFKADLLKTGCNKIHKGFKCAFDLVDTSWCLMKCPLCSEANAFTYKRLLSKKKDFKIIYVLVLQIIGDMLIKSSLI